MLGLKGNIPTVCQSFERITGEVTARLEMDRAVVDDVGVASSRRVQKLDRR